MSADAKVLAAAGVGSVFEKTSAGWNVKYVDGVTGRRALHMNDCAAIASHGAQVVHPTKRVVPHGIVEVEAIDAVGEVAAVPAADDTGEGAE